jgi:hypothetical protein
MVQGFNIGAPKSLLSKALLTGVVLLAACGKPAAQSAPVVEWTAVSIVEIPESLSESRLSRKICLQVQAQSDQKVFRLVGGNTPCAVDRAEALKSEEKIFEAPLALQDDGSFLIGEADRTLGSLRPLEMTGSTRVQRRYVLAELCQFSDPTVKHDGSYGEVCELKFADNGEALLGLELKTVNEIRKADEQDREQQLAAMANLDARSKELEKRIETLGKKIRLLEGYAQNEAIFGDLESKVEALRTELQLNSDATPEQIGAAVVRQGVLIRQFARELGDMKKNLDLPKDASFEDVLKALRETKKRPGELEKGPEPAPPAERKEANRSPISG